MERTKWGLCRWKKTERDQGGVVMEIEGRGRERRKRRAEMGGDVEASARGLGVKGSEAIDPTARIRRKENLNV